MSNQQTVIMVPAKAVRQDLKTETKTIVYMPLATTTNPGVVKIGEGLKIASDGLLSLNLDADWYTKVVTDVENIKTDVDELTMSVSDIGEILLDHDTRILQNTQAISSKADASLLANYYTKNETYSKEQVNALIVPTQGLRKEIVNTLPETGADNVLYMVPKIDASGNDYYDEYLYINGQWELVGTTQTSLEGYVTIEEFNKLVNNETQISSNANFSLVLGEGKLYGLYSVVIGKDASDNGIGSCVAVGYNATASGGSDNIVIGKFARTSVANSSIQLGNGTNNKSKTLQVFNDNIYNHETHTLTVQNIELNGEDLATKLESAGGSTITNVNDTITTEKLEGVVNLSTAQYLELLEKGELTVGDQTITYSDAVVYVTPEDDETNFVTLTDNQTITGLKTFTESIYLANADGTIDRISHINNNFIIYSGVDNGTALLNIDEGLSKIYAFNKELAFKEDIVASGGGTTVYVGGIAQDSISVGADIQTQLDTIAANVEDKADRTVVDQNTVDINAIELLVGTNITDISNLKTNKANADLSNVTYPTIISGQTNTGAGDRVVETYMASDGNTWYRKWASGWKECGGKFVSTQDVAAHSTRNYDKTLPLAFSNATYTVKLTTEWNGTNGGYVRWYTASNANTAENLRISSVNLHQTSSVAAGSVICNWYCCGY